jgi:hypothetical protein
MRGTELPASSKRKSFMSTATIGAQSATLAAITAAPPTAPMPTQQAKSRSPGWHVSPGSETLSAFIAALRFEAPRLSKMCLKQQQAGHRDIYRERDHHQG